MIPRKFRHAAAQQSPRYLATEAHVTLQGYPGSHYPCLGAERAKSIAECRPDGLLEYSVVYTDRAINHMSNAFQGVMKDISRIPSRRSTTRRAAVIVPAAAPSAWRPWHASSRPAGSAW